MAEENQVTTNEVQQVTTKNPKKVEVGKRLAEYNCKKREELKGEEQKSEVSQYDGTEAVLAVGVTGGLSYYLYRSKVNNVVPPQQPRPLTNKFEMD